MVDGTHGEKWRTTSDGALPIMLVFALVWAIAKRVRQRY